MKRYVIIGNGCAATGCIEGIRSVDAKGDITVVSAEKHHVYGRPLISYYLEGKTDLERMKYRPDSFYDDNNCKVLYGLRAETLDCVGKSVVLSDGATLCYDELCVATGSRPFVPGFEGLDTVKNKFSFMTLDDALALEQALSPQARVLIVGAGLIGLKCAEGIKDRVGSLTVCDLSDRVLSSILDDGCAAKVRERLQDCGIAFLLGDTAVSFDGDKAYMKSGKTVEFDILVLAVGVRAETELVASAGGSVGRGIIVDKRCSTDLPSVYAAGDCTEGFDSSVNQNRVLAIMPNAYIQGFTAGVNMAGGDREYTNAIPMNSIGFFGYHIMTAGVCEGEMITRESDGGTKSFFVKDGLLKGFILLGQTDRAGIYTALIRDKVPLETVDFDILKKVASNAGFSEEIRRKKFGGVV